MIVTYTSILSESTCFIHEFIIYQSNVKMISYCSLVPRSSNDSQAHLKFCFAKGACSLLNHVLTQPSGCCVNCNNDYCS